MENIVFDFFKKYSFLSLKDLYAIYQISSLKSFKSGEVIATKGSKYPYTLDIRKGIIRTYILTPDGEQKTVRIAKEGHFSSCAATLLYDRPSTEFLEVVEDCKVVSLNSEKLKALTKDNIRILRLWNDAIMKAFMDVIDRIEFLVTLTPEERYIRLLNESPDLLHRVPQKFLASYIGVTTVSLSRIRSRVAQNAQ